MPSRRVVQRAMRPTHFVVHAYCQEATFFEGRFPFTSHALETLNYLIHTHTHTHTLVTNGCIDAYVYVH